MSAPEEGQAEVVEWDFFVDESGTFENPESDVVVAGLLVRRGLPGTGKEELQETLKKIARDLDLPWPLHAAHYNKPVLLALGRHRRQQDAEARGWPLEPDPVATRAIEALMGRGLEPEVADAIARLREKRLPKHDDLKRLDDALKQSREELYWRLEIRRNNLSYSIQALLQQIGLPALKDADDVHAPPVLAFASSEAWKSAAFPPRADPFEAGSERYFTLLEAVMERLFRIMEITAERKESEYEIVPLVLERDVADLRRGRTVQLSRRHVDQVARSVCQDSTRARFRSSKTAAYNDDVHPFLVVADFIANRALGILSSKEGLRTVEEELKRRLGEGVWLRTSGKTHLAAVPLGANRTGSHPRQWALEQPQEWP